MNMIKQGLTEFRIPAYIEEILTHNYCSSFLRMNLVREEGTYRFSYRPGNMTRLQISKLSSYEKMTLIRTLIYVCENARGYLIGGENYLLEPELIFASPGGVIGGDIRIMFYPDVKRLGFEHKILLFAERIRNNNNKEERDLFDQFRRAAESGELNRIKLFIDKNIMRMENRMTYKAG